MDLIHKSRSLVVSLMQSPHLIVMKADRDHVMGETQV